MYSSDNSWTAISCRETRHLKSSVFGIRVRHRSQTSVSFPRSVCESLFLQTILHLVLQLVDFILISELFVSCLVPVNFGLRQLPFSSVTVIRLDLFLDKHIQVLSRFCHTDWLFDFLTPTQFRLRSTALFGITTLPSISFVDFSFTCSCNSPVFSSSVVPCHSALLLAVHLTHLPLLDISQHLRRTSSIVAFTLGNTVLALHVILA